MGESEEEKKLWAQILALGEPGTPEDFQRWSELHDARRRAERGRRQAMTQAEKEREFLQRAGEYYSERYEEFSLGNTFGGYYELIELRMTHYELDWRSKSNQVKLELFDRAARDASRHLDYNLNRYLRDELRRKFTQDHEIVED